MLFSLSCRVDLCFCVSSVCDCVSSVRMFVGVFPCQKPVGFSRVKSAKMLPTSLSPNAAAAATTDALMHTGHQHNPARGAVSEPVTGGRADPGPRMVPTSGTFFTPECAPHASSNGAAMGAAYPASGQLPTDAVLQMPLFGAAQWPTPGAAYRPFAPPPAASYYTAGSDGLARV